MFGFKMTEYVNDNLIVAWGARMIVSRSGELTLLPDRQGIIGKQSMVNTLLEIVHQHALPAARSYARLNHHFKDESHNVWGGTLTPQPMRMDMRFEDGYCYIRVGIKHADLKNTLWSGSRPKIGEKVKVSSDIGEVVTYITTPDGYQFGFAYCSTRLSETQRPWHFLINFTCVEYEEIGENNEEKLQHIQS